MVLEDEPKVGDAYEGRRERPRRGKKRLGDWYNEGIVVTEDHKMAATLYKKASDDGLLRQFYARGLLF